MFFIRLLFIAWCAILVLISSPGQAQASTEMFYPASMCTPISANDFDGNGRSGLYMTQLSPGWANDAKTQHRKLKCPIPYEFDRNDTSSITVRIQFQPLTGEDFFGGLIGYDPRSSFYISETQALLAGGGSGLTVWDYILGDEDNEKEQIGRIRFLELDITVPDKRDPDVGRDVVNSFLGYRVFRGAP